MENQTLERRVCVCVCVCVCTHIPALQSLFSDAGTARLAPPNLSPVCACVVCERVTDGERERERGRRRGGERGWE